MNIKYTTELLHNEDLYELYEISGWNHYLQLSSYELNKAMKQSFYVVYAYLDGMLIGTGRVISDGVINGYLCGLGVHPSYRSQGIGREITRRLLEKCEENKLHPQLFCEEKLVPYYEHFGLKVFAVGMKTNI
ncbi:GNAT family N-acetyltransferase [Geosporobacter ferrireducens]|uniref:GNAT family N-acetyltransferase n=1 Tax=Geosporobacter ferrireducens TaxID=1424294 RepID=A0A1D8GMF3_9FIRM|nr:GNAT family N-acetyltransferase [Geosporobacter ferrireducens]AOT72111.1 GNAT family N-acetyltransferase [Geosporobacter ferrireducens]MTI55999.1 N-acetyltransferase [Geosporobacter ferrireducens]